ncbi:MAG: hypothetical protein AAF702_48765 [Chloroflexota bacterium]
MSIIVPPVRKQLINLVEVIFNGKDANGRLDILKLASLHQFEGNVDLSGVAESAATSVVITLEEYSAELTIWPGYTPLGALLWYILGRDDLPPVRHEQAAKLVCKYKLITDVDFLAELGNRFPSIGHSEEPSAQNIHNALRQGRQVREENSAERPQYQLDEEEILQKFDLEDQADNMRKPLISAGKAGYGLVPFFTTGDYRNLIEYVEPWAIDYLKTAWYRKVENREEVRLFHSDLPVEKVMDLINGKLTEYTEGLHLDEFVAQPEIDTFLRIVNDNIPRKIAQQTAQQLVSELKEVISTQLQQKSSIFVLLWIDNEKESMPTDSYCPIDPLQPLPKRVVYNWFEQCLKSSGVEEFIIVESMKELTKRYQIHRGNPQAVYSAMQTIIRKVNRGKKPS